jgi:hypothetical protein
MMIGAINKKNIDGTMLQRLGYSKSPETSPYNDDKRNVPFHLSLLSTHLSAAS